MSSFGSLWSTASRARAATSPSCSAMSAIGPPLGPYPRLVMSRTYEIRTYGCQMNVHDSERLSGLLEDAGYARATDGAADLVVFNTCAVRENADNRLYGNLGHLYPAKVANPDMQIAVGGCLAQKDKSRIVEKARHNKQAEVEIVDALQNFPSDLPSRRESPFSAWVSVSVGCDNTCTFCIVPSLRGKETDRRP